MLATATFTAFSQPRKAAKMAPVLVPGYYTTMKGDTVKGEVQSNPDDITDFYNGFNFKPSKGGKPMPVNSKKAKSYGFEGRDFAVIPFESGEIYAEYVVRGRLVLMKYRRHEKKDGEEVIGTEYFIQDTKADETDKDLRELKQISQKFYKRDLKPYLKQQPMIWSDMDKFTFEENAIANSLREFNKMYE